MKVVLVAQTFIRNPIPDYQWSPVGPGEDPFEAFGPEPTDELAEMAGRLCYQSWDRPNPATATNDGYLANIIAQGHESVLAHASATFYIEVSRNCTHELIRHRFLSFSEVSQRYVDASEFPFVVHPELEGVLYGDEHETGQMRSLYRRVYELLTANGKSRKTARGAARQVLPGGLQTKMLVSGNLRAWRDFLRQRLHPAADAEIRALAIEILRQLKKIAPNTFQDFDEQGQITVERKIRELIDDYDGPHSGPLIAKLSAILDGER